MDNIINGMRPIHPGEILREEFLSPMNLSSNALAIELHVPAPRINEIVRERRSITADTALRLARYLEQVLNSGWAWQDDYDLKTCQRKLDETLGRIIPRQ